MECPFCAELIKKKAKLCRYCKSELPSDDASSDKGDSTYLRPAAAIAHKKTADGTLTTNKTMPSQFFHMESGECLYIDGNGLHVESEDGLTENEFSYYRINVIKLENQETINTVTVSEGMVSERSGSSLGLGALGAIIASDNNHEEGSTSVGEGFVGGAIIGNTLSRKTKGSSISEEVKTQTSNIILDLVDGNKVTISGLTHKDGEIAYKYALSCFLNARECLASKIESAEMNDVGVKSVFNEQLQETTPFIECLEDALRGLQIGHRKMSIPTKKVQSFVNLTRRNHTKRSLMRQNFISIYKK